MAPSCGSVKQPRPQANENDKPSCLISEEKSDDEKIAPNEPGKNSSDNRREGRRARKQSVCRFREMMILKDVTCAEMIFRTKEKLVRKNPLANKKQINGKGGNGGGVGEKRSAVDFWSGVDFQLRRSRKMKQKHCSATFLTILDTRRAVCWRW